VVPLNLQSVEDYLLLQRILDGFQRLDLEYQLRAIKVARRMGRSWSLRAGKARGGSGVRILGRPAEESDPDRPRTG
jgi:hypothetical protein